MKIKKGYTVRNVAGSNIVIPTGEKVVDFNGIITLNETALFIWNLLSDDLSEEEIVNAVSEEYDADEIVIKNDVKAFIKKLEDSDLVE